MRRGLETILIVDDEQDIRDAVCELLRDALHDIRVIAAEDAETARVQLARGRVDLIFSDFKMPGENGLDFLRRVREQHPGIPCVLMTAFADVPLAVRAINEAEIDRFLPKPLDPEEVIETVWTLLDRRRNYLSAQEQGSWSLDALRRKDKHERQK